MAQTLSEKGGKSSSRSWGFKDIAKDIAMACPTHMPIIPQTAPDCKCDVLESTDHALPAYAGKAWRERTVPDAPGARVRVGAHSRRDRAAGWMPRRGLSFPMIPDQRIGALRRPSISPLPPIVERTLTRPTGTRLGDLERTAIELDTVEPLDGVVTGRILGHLHKAEPLAPPTVLVRDDGRIIDGAGLLEQGA